MIRKIQEKPPGSEASPIFLFHDASGTISSYYALGALNRDVYAIANNPSTEKEKQESFAAMGRRYCAAIKSLIPEGRIILGGWSLGGMLALQVAYNFARDTRVIIDGVIMIDAPFPDYDGLDLAEIEKTVNLSDDVDELSAQDILERSILSTVKMLRGYKAPVWKREKQPHTVMLRATEQIVCDDQPALGFVDQFRDSESLGWNDRAGSQPINKTHAIPGHHFGIFVPDNIDAVTQSISSVAIAMEKMTEEDDSD